MAISEQGQTPIMRSSLPGPDGVRASFDRVADVYDQYAILEREVGSRLLERLVFQKSPPRRILDLGCGTGACTAALKKKYRKAEVIGLDSSHAMLHHLRRKSSFLRPLQAVCADYSRLPFAARTVDLLFSNLALQWCVNFHELATELRYAMKPGGMLVFSTLGPDSLQELREIAGAGELRAFPDLHDMGDALQAAGFLRPVMDSERITLSFRGFDALLQETENSGASTHFTDWDRFVRTAMASHGSRQNPAGTGLHPLTYEIVYGVAFGPQEGQPFKTRDGDIATFSVETLRAAKERRRGLAAARASQREASEISALRSHFGWAIMSAGQFRKTKESAAI